MEKLLLISITLLIIIFFFGSVSCCNVPAIFTFGDSIFDAGNNHFIKNCTIQADFPPYGQDFFHHPTGRCTNGRTVVDFISQFIGINLQKPYLEAVLEIVNGSRKDYPLNGLNFASAGSGVLDETNKDMGVMSIQDQLKNFLNLVKQNKINKQILQHSIFFFESGSNDIFNYFLPFLSNQTVEPEVFVQAMLTQVQNWMDGVYEAGARRIAIFSLGPVGCIPARLNLPGATIGRCYGKMNKMIKMYNLGLENLVVHRFPIKYPGAVGVYGALYELVQLFRAMPQRYGFSNTTAACCGEGSLRGYVQCGTGEYEMCENPSEYLFWDYFHPTEHAYKLISKALWEGDRSRIRPLNLKTLSNITLPIS